MKKRGYYSAEVRERAVRLVFTQEAEHASQWAAISSIAEKVGCTAETLRKWVRRSERDSGRRPGLTTDERERLKDLERENGELKRANEILRKASAYFAQADLDREPVHVDSDAAVLRGQHHVIALATVRVAPNRPVRERAEERRDLALHRGHVGFLSRILPID